MTDERMEEIYALADAALRNGQKAFPVHIFPFRMSKENMKKYEKSEFFSFWNNLKEGYDLFEQNKLPPGISIKGRAIHFYRRN
jgi:murein L,D-transpeptidase YafK